MRTGAIPSIGVPNPVCPNNENKNISNGLTEANEGNGVETKTDNHTHILILPQHLNVTGIDKGFQFQSRCMLIPGADPLSIGAPNPVCPNKEITGVGNIVINKLAEANEVKVEMFIEYENDNEFKDIESTTDFVEANKVIKAETIEEYENDHELIVDSNVNTFDYVIDNTHTFDNLNDTCVQESHLPTEESEEGNNVESKN